MKLIQCKKCLMVLSLGFEPRECSCGKSGGYYRDRLHAVYWGEIFPLGFDTTEFKNAKKNQPKDGRGVYFEAFVMPKDVPTLTRIRRPKLE